MPTSVHVERRAIANHSVVYSVARPERLHPSKARADPLLIARRTVYDPANAISGEASAAVGAAARIAHVQRMAVRAAAPCRNGITVAPPSG